MGSTGDPRGESSLALYGPVTSSCKRGAGRKVAPARHDIRPALSVIDHAQHRSLFRLAVLLTGDADAAERWCWTPLPRCTARGSPRRRGTTPAAPGAAPGGPVTPGQASPSLRRQQAAPWWGRGRPLHQHSAQAAHLARTRLAPRAVLHSTSEYQPCPRPAALAGQPVPAPMSAS